MALFKISKGSKNNLPATLTEGYCWYTLEDSKFYIDYKDEKGVLVRKALNAQEAEKLLGYDIVTTLNASDSEIATSAAILDALEALKVELANQDVAILAEAQADASNKAAVVLAETQKRLDEYKSAIADVTELPENANDGVFYRLFTATFIHNRHIVDNSKCYCVETLPESGEPATDGNQSITAYYNMSDKQVYGYLNETLASAFGIPAGWYDAGTLLTAQGWDYAGVISDIALDPNDSTIRVLLNTKVYISINNSYKEVTNDELNERFPVITEAGHWVHTVQNREGKEPEYTALPISHSPNDTAKYQIPLREDGVIKTQAPRERLDVANKEYVDTQIQDKAYGNDEKKYHTTNIHYYTDEANQGNASIGLHQNAEESEQEHIPLRQKNGLMTANVPENAPDNAVVNKGYVNSAVSQKSQVQIITWEEND